MLVDNCGMQLVLAPDQFDVILTENTFGTSSPTSPPASLAASASPPPPASATATRDLRARARLGTRYRRPGIANPAAMLRSAALMLAHGLDEPGEAARVEAAVDVALASSPTPDLGGQATTAEFTDAVLRELSLR